jgi:DNA-binding CsgD family transcriptional regulator/PAS domain-containing protein
MPQSRIPRSVPAARQGVQVRDLATRLATLVEGEGPAMTWFVPAFRDFLGCDIVVALQVEDVIGDLELKELRTSGMPFPPAEVSRQVQQLVRSEPFGLFNARRPQAQQRNVVFDLGRCSDFLDQTAPPTGMGIGREEMDRFRANARAAIARFPVIRFCSEQHLLRALVCERETLLAWVGALQADPFTPHQLASFEAILGELARRLALDQLVEKTPVTAAALETTLDAIPAAAFVLSESGRICHANAAGRRWASDHRTGLTAALGESMRGAPDAQFSITRFAAPDRRPQFLAIARRASGMRGPAAAAAKSWELTARQTQVLLLLAEGKANKVIAAELSCAVHTVELHVAALLEKARCDSRSELIARLWSF